MFMKYLRIKLYTPSSSGSLFIVIKPIVKERNRMTTMALFFYISQKMHQLEKA
jgi:hypothetical protein